MSDPDRLIDLEIALTHAQAAQEDLSAEVRAQAARIDRIERLLERLALRLAAAEREAGAPPEPDARPPHW